MNKFAIGEPAILVLQGNGEVLKLDCEIVATPNHGIVAFHNEQYVINVPCEPNPNKGSKGLWSTEESYLRKKKPPKEFKASSWDEVQDDTKWNPTKETVH